MSSARKRSAVLRANAEAEYLRQKLMRAEHQLSIVTGIAKKVAEDYGELIFAVGLKFPGESRHETALRYLRNAELPTGGHDGSEP